VAPLNLGAGRGTPRHVSVRRKLSEVLESVGRSVLGKMKSLEIRLLGGGGEILKVKD